MNDSFGIFLFLRLPITLECSMSQEMRLGMRDERNLGEVARYVFMANFT